MAAEGTHTSESVYGLSKALSRGGRLWAGKISIAADDDILTTGLDTIESVGVQAEELAAVDADTPVVVVSDVSKGTVTFHTGKLGAYGATAAPAWVIVIGTARGYHA